MNFVVLPGQLRLALCLCYTGMASALIYDALFPLRRGRACLVAADMVYGLVTGGMYALAHAFCGDVQPRLPGLIFFAVGFGLYRMGPGRMGRFLLARFAGRKNDCRRRKERDEERM